MVQFIFANMSTESKTFHFWNPSCAGNIISSIGMPKLLMKVPRERERGEGEKKDKVDVCSDLPSILPTGCTHKKYNYHHDPRKGRGIYCIAYKPCGSLILSSQPYGLFTIPCKIVSYPSACWAKGKQTSREELKKVKGDMECSMQKNK